MSDPFWDFSFQNDSLIEEHRNSLQINAREVVWETAMAVRAFALEKGHNPRNLNELVPRYLTKIENDPFDDSHQLRYSPASKTYRQWFKGKPIYTKKLPPDSIPEVSYLPNTASAPKPTGYHLISRIEKLPFVLYSVGFDERDEGGFDFKAAGKKPTPQGGMFPFYDDVIAPVEWFRKPALPESSKIYSPGPNSPA